MIRKTAAAIAAFMVFLAVTAQAVEYPNVKYGKRLLYANAEGKYFMYSNVNEGFSCGITDTQAHSGKRSFRIDCKSADVGKKTDIEASTSLSNVDCVNNNVLVEMYVKGFEGEKPGSVSFYLYLTDSDGAVSSADFSIDAADENGWHRVRAYLPHRAFKNVRFGTVYTRKSYCTMTYYYIDDASVVYLPAALYAGDCTAEKESVSLDRITVVGEDANGARKKIDLSDVLKYSVISGDAYIDSSANLVYTGTDGGTAEIEAALYDIKTRFNVNFNGNARAEQITETETAFQTVIKNGTGGDCNAVLAVVLLDSGRLADISLAPVCVEAGAAQTVSCKKPAVPFYVKNPEYKAFLHFENR